MNILITGGTGSLGTALVKRLYDSEHEITIFSRSETKQSLMRKKYPRCRYILGDIADEKDLQLAFRGIDLVYHFAAYKQVPSAQNNARATIRTNVIGSQNVVYEALESGVEKVVATSTDKATSPVNLYGTSKLAMESIFQDANKYGNTSFHLARYGNVVCSNSSVIPLFRKQVAEGGPITITHLDMTRFWISLDTALDLIDHALTASPGIIVVPEAKSMSVIGVARAVVINYCINTLGWSENKALSFLSTEIKEIGIRAGEKIHEAMVSESESFYTERMPVKDVRDIEHVYYIHPPTASFRSMDAPFSYTSDGAESMSIKDLIQMVDEYDLRDY